MYPRLCDCVAVVAEVGGEIGRAKRLRRGPHAVRPFEKVGGCGECPPPPDVTAPSPANANEKNPEGPFSLFVPALASSHMCGPLHRMHCRTGRDGTNGVMEVPSYLFHLFPGSTS